MSPRPEVAHTLVEVQSSSMALVVLPLPPLSGFGAKPCPGDSSSHDAGRAFSSSPMLSSCQPTPQKVKPCSGGSHPFLSPGAADSSLLVMG